MARSFYRLRPRFARAGWLVALALSGCSGAQALPDRPPAAVTPDAIGWVANPRFRGVASATVVGDPSARGIYVTLGKMEPGATFPAHTHPDRRITTVISGTMHYGTGPVFDRSRLRAFPAGSIVETPPGVPHFMLAGNGATVMQETGFGPTGLELSPQ